MADLQPKLSSFLIDECDRSGVAPDVQAIRGMDGKAVVRIDARNCSICGWVLPRDITGQCGPCPVCDRRVHGSTHDH